MQKPNITVAATPRTNEIHIVAENETFPDGGITLTLTLDAAQKIADAITRAVRKCRSMQQTESPFQWAQVSETRWQWQFIAMPDQPVAFAEIHLHPGQSAYWGILDQGRVEQLFSTWEDAAKWVERTWHECYQASEKI
jgi:hypothetical protein